MAEWPATGNTDWNTKMLAYLAIAHSTDGFDKYPINDTPTKVLVKILTGTTDNDASTSVAHGIADVDKIWSVTSMIWDSDGAYNVYDNQSAAVAGNGYKLTFDATNIVLGLVEADLRVQNYRIMIWYSL